MKTKEEINEEMNKVIGIFQGVTDNLKEFPPPEILAGFFKGLSLLSRIDALQWVLETKEFQDLEEIKKELERELIKISRELNLK